MTTPLPSSVVQGCWTIDATSATAGGDDNGYLDNARGFVLAAAWHGSRSAACGNLLRCASSGTPDILNIVGHGYLGIICTGAGLDHSDASKCIAAGDESDWPQTLGSLARQGTRLRFWSCHTGAGQPGAALLHDLAQLLKCPCEAPTGFITCDPVAGFALEPGACWQVALPDLKAPMPEFPPGHHALLGVADWSLQVAPNERATLSQVVLVQGTMGRAYAASLPLAAAKAALQLVDVSHPRRIAAPLGALVTSRLSLTFQLPGGRTAVKSLSVYNDRLVFAEDEPSVYYPCDDNFAAALALSFQ